MTPAAFTAFNQCSVKQACGHPAKHELLVVGVEELEELLPWDQHAAAELD